jgi:Chaperone of endosialidase
MRSILRPNLLGTVVFVLASLLASRNAEAQTCVDSSGSFFGASTNSNPSADYCSYLDYLSVGPGTSFLAQDQSVATSHTYGAEVTSLNNVGLLAISGAATVPSVTSAVVATAAGSGIYGGYFRASGQFAVYGQSSNTDSIHGYYDGTVATSAVSGQNDGTGNGLYGTTGSSSYYGVQGYNSAGVGVSGQGTTHAVEGTSSGTSGTDAGVWGSGAVYGLYGTSSGTSGTDAGVYGTGSHYGVYGTSSAANAIYGVYSGTGSSNGVEGDSTSSTGDGNGVFGLASGSGAGVYGKNTSSTESGYGVLGATDSANGVSVYGICLGAECTAIVGDTNGQTRSLAGQFNGAVNVTGELTVGSCSGCTSDIRLKKDVKPLSGAIDELLRLKGVTFAWKNPEEHENHAGTQTGFIAQDVQKLFPEWVKEDGYTAPDGKKYKTLDTRQIEALEVESIRTLKTTNDLQQAEIETLKEHVRALANGEHPNVGGPRFNFNQLGWFASGVLATLFWVSRRKRAPQAV